MRSCRSPADMKKLLLATLAAFLFLVPLPMSAQPSTPLTPWQQAIVRIAALTAIGNLPGLHDALATGLDQGLSINEEKEVLAQLYAYCGFPRSLNGLNTLIQVVAERKAQGRHDPMGREASPITDTAPKYERGKRNLEKLTGKPEPALKTGANAFCPEIDVFLKEHLFADIFERDVLTFQERELATNAALVSLGGVEAQLQSHLGICLHLGLTEAQLRQLLDVTGAAVGQPAADAGRAVLSKALASRQP